MKTVYVDESKQGPYLLAGHIVDDSQAVELRNSFKKIFPKTLRHFHFSQEQDSRRKKVLRHFVTEDCFGILVICQRQKGKRLRETALKELVALSEACGVERFVLDLDISTKVADDKVFIAHNELKGRLKKVKWDHVEYESEPLLWVADGVGWAYNRKGHWLRMVRPIIKYQTEC